MRQVGAEWNVLTEEQKAPFNAKHDADVKRYEGQVKQLKEKGYFIMADGTKSTDHQGTVNRKRKTAGNLTNSPAKKRVTALTEGKAGAAAK